MDVLIVEIGNSVTDFAVFKGEHCRATYTIQTGKFSDTKKVQGEAARILGNHPDITDAALCSVVPVVGKRFLQTMQALLPGRVLEIQSSLSLPFVLDYDPPAALGADRLALCAFCRSTSPGEAVIAVDIGTAITFDVLSSKGVYLGGMILPGLDLMSAALHDRTAKLPLVRINKPVTPFLGKSTAECMQSGVFWGCVKEVEGLIEGMHRFLENDIGERNRRVVVTGGSGKLVASAMKNPPEIDEQAVLKGAKVLLDLNIRQAG